MGDPYLKRTMVERENPCARYRIGFVRVIDNSFGLLLGIGVGVGTWGEVHLRIAYEGQSGK